MEIALEEYGSHAGRGNLLGIQPWVEPDDYASEQTFCAKLNGYMDVARQQGWLNGRTVVVWPEYVGAWLVVVGEGAQVYRSHTITGALTVLVARHSLAFARAWQQAWAKDRTRYAAFRVKAARAAAIYQQAFSRLAREYGVTVVAGSIVLPTPRIEGGQLAIGDGALYNTSVVYKPDGQAHPWPVCKAFPIADELSFITAAPVQDLPVFDTPAGRLGVLICADSWYPEPYRALASRGVELVAVPSYLSPDDVWEASWRGYSGADPPADVDMDDVNRLSEGQAWLKYALAGRMASCGAGYGINVFLRGHLWDLGSDGHTILVRGNEVIEGQHVAGAAMANSWL